MNCTRLLHGTFVFSLSLPQAVHAQGTLADYERAAALKAKYEAAALNIPEKASWLDGDRFWYRKSVAGGHVFVIVNALTNAKSPAFDHDKLAASLNKAAGTSFNAATLPFANI